MMRTVLSGMAPAELLDSIGAVSGQPATTVLRELSIG
jgi:hypothetical protein